MQHLKRVISGDVTSVFRKQFEDRVRKGAKTIAQAAVDGEGGKGASAGYYGPRGEKMMYAPQPIPPYSMRPILTTAQVGPHFYHALLRTSQPRYEGQARGGSRRLGRHLGLRASGPSARASGASCP